MRAAIFGDVGGHFAPLARALESLGVNLDSGIIPSDLHIIQVGDLIHKGPNTDELVALVDHLMAQSPDQWTQLVGNHEAMHLNMSVPFFNSNCSPDTIQTLQRWWEEGQIHLATSFTGESAKRLVLPETLVTHAGMTFGVWQRVGRPKSAAEVVQGIQKASVGVYGKPGYMLGDRARWNAGVFWAHSTNETYPSWLEEDMPFNQVHGHCPPFNFERNDWWVGKSSMYRRGKPYTFAYPDDRAYVLHTRSAATFVCIDPGFEKSQPVARVQPWLEVTNFVKTA